MNYLKLFSGKCMCMQNPTVGTGYGELMFLASHALLETMVCKQLSNLKSSHSMRLHYFELYKSFLTIFKHD